LATFVEGTWVVAIGSVGITVGLVGLVTAILGLKQARTASRILSVFHLILSLVYVIVVGAGYGVSINYWFVYFSNCDINNNNDPLCGSGECFFQTYWFF
jgi:hypothetical protein